MMKFYAVIRQTEDWLNLDEDKFISGELYREYAPPQKEQLRKNVEAWKQYKTGLFEYRAKLKELSYEFMVGMGWEIISLQDALDIFDENVYIIPVDDDDIINFNVTKRINSFRYMPIDAIHWDTWVYSVLNHRPQLMVESDAEPGRYGRLVPSNSYAIRADLATDNLLVYHNRFSEYRKCQQLFIPEQWSLRFVHPGGIFIMQQMLTAHPLSLHKTKIDVPDDLRWARMYIEKVSELTWSIIG